MYPAHNSPMGEPEPPTAWVADVGGSHVTAALVELGPTPRVIDRASTDIAPHGDADAILGTICSALRAVAAESRSCTIALPGPFNYEAGSGTFAGVEKFGALAGVDLRARLGSALGIDPLDVRFVNDAVAYGRGEWVVSARRPDRFVCITLGTGVGSAFLDRGRPVESGPEVPPHGWAHLLTIDDAPLEDSVSTRAIQRRFARATGEELSVLEIARRARDGESPARAVLDDAMSELGGALGPWIARFGASEVVVGGSMARSWDLLGPAFARGMASAGAKQVNPRGSTLFDDAPLIGAAVRA